MSEAQQMHDWTISRIEFDWSLARVKIELEDMTYTTRTLIAEGVKDLHVPRANDWGPSVSVNKVSGIEPHLSGFRLTIQIQSGDVIEIVADKFTFPVP